MLTINKTTSIPTKHKILEHTIITVEISDLNFADYTRRISERQVNRMVSDFDPNRFDLPVVNFRDGKLWVVDGKQRIEAAKRRGYTNIQCRLLAAEETTK